MSRFPLLLTSGLTALILTGCRDEPEPLPDADPGYSLARFASCDDMRDYMTEAYTETLLGYRYGYGYGYDSGAEESGDDSSGGGSGPTDYSETNVQEAGVDEPDIVKTDGEYIYYVQDDALFVVDSWPAGDAALVSEVSLGGYPHAMFLDGDRLAVFSYVYSGDYGGTEGDRESGDGGSWKSYARTRVSIIDITDRTSPEVVREVDLDGYYANARMIDSDIYLITTTWMDMPSALWELAWREDAGLPAVDWDATADEVTAARDAAREILLPQVGAILAGMSEGELLPLYRDQVPGADQAPETLLACTDIYRPPHLSYPAVMTVAHIDLADEGAVGVGSDVSGTGLMSDGWTVYASTENLYIAQTSWYWYWGWGESTTTTHIHRFALDGADSVYAGSGEVDGWLLSQFAMSEHDGYLRVATTDTSGWGWGWAEDAVSTDSAESGTSGGAASGTTAKAEDEDLPANNVFVLQSTDGGLEQVGALTGLAPEEQIYAVRFMGDRGYLVTFYQVDPLFTIDLSDPTAPALVGELKVPGYSSYLHPLGDDFLLAIGMDGTEDGAITGLAVSLFDVSDFANPTLATKFTLESDDWSYSEALYDHHAFTYHRGVLSFPAYTWSWDGDTGEWDGFSGLIALEVDTGEESGAPALTELGRVDHADLIADSECYYARYYGEDTGYDPCEVDYWYAWVRRSVVIEDGLYSLSNYGVKVNALTEPETELARVLFYPAQ